MKKSLFLIIILIIILSLASCGKSNREPREQTPGGAGQPGNPGPGIIPDSPGGSKDNLEACLVECTIEFSQDDLEGLASCNDACYAQYDNIDTDGDGFSDTKDNCRYDANPDQKDSNNNGVGDVCEESDDDEDGIPNGQDNYPFCYNPEQELDGYCSICLDTIDPDVCCMEYYSEYYNDGSLSFEVYFEHLIKECNTNLSEGWKLDLATSNMIMDPQTFVDDNQADLGVASVLCISGLLNPALAPIVEIMCIDAVATIGARADESLIEIKSKSDDKSVIVGFELEAVMDDYEMDFLAAFPEPTRNEFNTKHISCVLVKYKEILPDGRLSEGVKQEIVDNRNGEGTCVLPEETSNTNYAYKSSDSGDEEINKTTSFEFTDDFALTGIDLGGTDCNIKGKILRRDLREDGYGKNNAGHYSWFKDNAYNKQENIDFDGEQDAEGIEVRFSPADLGNIDYVITGLTFVGSDVYSGCGINVFPEAMPLLPVPHIATFEEAIAGNDEELEEEE
ncbi:MAG: thrombospondin type 3 repeat-containing protein [Pseudomonadota bacterium]